MVSWARTNAPGKQWVVRIFHSMIEGFRPIDWTPLAGLGCCQTDVLGVKVMCAVVMPRTVTSQAAGWARAICSDADPIREKGFSVNDHVPCVDLVGMQRAGITSPRGLAMLDAASLAVRPTGDPRRFGGP